MGYAFISYSSKNQKAADGIRELLNTNGFQTWMAPYDIPTGHKYAEVINRAIQQCTCMILIFSQQAQESVWVPREVERAINSRKPILPVQIGDVTLNDEFQLYIGSEQIVFMPRIDRHLETTKRLLQDLKALMGTNEPQVQEGRRIVHTNHLFPSEDFHLEPDSGPKQIELTVWSPVNTEVYLNDKSHPVMRIDRDSGFDYECNTICVSGTFALLFSAKGFEKTVAFEADQIDGQLSYRLQAILSKKEIRDSYDREEAVNQIQEVPTGYAFEQLACVGTAGDIPLVQATLKKLCTLNGADNHTNYLVARCASTLGKLAFRFDCPEKAAMILPVYEKYPAKAAYGYLITPIVDALKQRGIFAPNGGPSGTVEEEFS